jgi:hypothetical protein
MPVVGDNGGGMSEEREKLAKVLDGQFKGGTLSSVEKIKVLAEYDALVATKRLPFYALLSTIAAAVSAIASAAAAYFAYAALHISH